MTRHSAIRPAPTPPTRTEWADERVRELILNGDVGPGDALVISALAEDLGVSATPLREALGRLASEGLVELRSHGSARVATVDLYEASEIYELRQLLEPMAIERAVAKADDHYRQGVEKAWGRLTSQRIASASDHAAFHRALVANCDSGWLLRITTMLADRAGLMIAAALPGRPDDYDTGESHRVLKELAMSGDAQGAADELARHLNRTMDALRELTTTPTTAPTTSEKSR